VPYRRQQAEFPKIQEEILLSEDKALFNIPVYKLRNVIAEVDWNKQQGL